MGQESGLDTERLRDSMSESRHSIERTVDQLRRRVRTGLDWRSHVSRHPLPALGVVMVGGLLAGRMAAETTEGLRSGSAGARLRGDGAWGAGAQPSRPRAFQGVWNRARSRAEGIVDRVIDGTGDAVETIVVPALLDNLSEFLGGVRRRPDGRPAGVTGRP